MPGKRRIRAPPSSPSVNTSSSARAFSPKSKKSNLKKAKKAPDSSPDSNTKELMESIREYDSDESAEQPPLKIRKKTKGPGNPIASTRKLTIVEQIARDEDDKEEDEESHGDDDTDADAHLEALRAQYREIFNAMRKDFMEKDAASERAMVDIRRDLEISIKSLQSNSPSK